MGDVEDPDLYAAQPLYDWQTSEMGEFMKVLFVVGTFDDEGGRPSGYGKKFIDAFIDACPFYLVAHIFSLNKTKSKLCYIFCFCQKIFFW
jgi:hypothetical protein